MAKLNKNIVAVEKQAKSKANVGEKKNAAKRPIPADSIVATAKNTAKKQKKLTANIVPGPKSDKTKKPDAAPVDTSVADSNDSESENEKDLKDSTVSKQRGGKCLTIYINHFPSYIVDVFIFQSKRVFLLEEDTKLRLCYIVFTIDAISYLISSLIRNFLWLYSICVCWQFAFEH